MKNGAERTSLRLFHSQLLKTEAAMAFRVLVWQKNKFCTDMLGLLSPKTIINLC
jgi:hypothetical protein